VATIPGLLEERLLAPFDRTGETWYYESTWSRHFQGMGLVETVETRFRTTITRASMCARVDDTWDEAPIDAFLCVMQWGYGPQARGAARTAGILGRDLDQSRRSAHLAHVGESLRASAIRARAGDARGAYAALAVGGDNKIDGLGSAFFTKWLYATSSRGDVTSPDALPILDSVVSAWMNRNTGTKFGTEDADAYVEYVATLRRWSASLTGNSARTAAQLEHEIFALAREKQEAAPA